MSKGMWIAGTFAVGLAIAAGFAINSVTAKSNPGPAASPSHAIDTNKLQGAPLSETQRRVADVFPHGPATEDAVGEVGTAPAPPGKEDKPDPASEWVAEISPSSPMTADQIRAAIPKDETGARSVRVHVVGTERWIDPAAADVTQRFDTIAVIADFVDFSQGEQTIAAADVDGDLAYARAIAEKIGTGAPAPSMTAAEAVKKGKAVAALRKAISDDDRSMKVYVATPKGKLFPGKLVWDALYSAGFTWGQGDAFHWRPSKTTDVSQGITVRTTTGTGYFFPESLAANDGSADVGSLDLSFDLAHVWQPERVLDVMLHTASYAARRLGGTVASTPDGKAFDDHAAHDHVAKIAKKMVDAGVVPGSRLALRAF